MFSCKDCGATAPRWSGRCAHCGAWSSLEAAERSAGRRARPPPPRTRPLQEVATDPLERLVTGHAELDRTLGGGVVPGASVLIGGEPGIGKSTLLLAVSDRFPAPSLYVAGEESPRQIALRARRLGLEGRALSILDSTDTDEIADVLAAERPALCVVDSVQSLRTDSVDGVPGGPAQVRAAAERLVPVARETGTALFLVGQVTKVGGLAGPRFLEHAVDTVVLFEGDRRLSVRVLRVVKNRFGPTDEIGLFEMREDGMREVRHASELLLAARADDDTGPGAVVACVVEGRRALCVEVQALVVGDKRKGSHRRALGVDPRRAELLVGVVESLYSRALAERDVYVNVVGGLAVRDTGLDLGLASAVLGQAHNTAVDPRAVVIGEVGLRGEVRAVPRMSARLKEARAMGFVRAYVPRGTEPLTGIELTEVRRLDEVLAPPEPPPGGRSPA